MGVVIFILVVGYLPFSEATEEDSYFQLLQNGQKDQNGLVTKYWNQFRCQFISDDFKRLMQLILVEDPSQRTNL